MIEVPTLNVLPSDCVALIQEFIGDHMDQLEQSRRFVVFWNKLERKIVDRCSNLALSYEADASMLFNHTVAISRWVTPWWIRRFVFTNGMAPNFYYLLNGEMLEELEISLHGHIISAYEKFCDNFCNSAHAAMTHQVNYRLFNNPNGFIELLEHHEEVAYNDSINYLRDHRACFDWQCASPSLVNYVPFALRVVYAPAFGLWEFKYYTNSFPEFVRIRGKTFIDCQIRPVIKDSGMPFNIGNIYCFGDSMIAHTYSMNEDDEIMDLYGFEDTTYNWD